jgi:hypothetical protein
MVFLSCNQSASSAMSFACSGANTLAADDSRTVSPTAVQWGGIPLLLAGLTAGATTFKAKYKSGSGTVSFAQRRISAIPL